ncbi:MAG: right-handed parallel beta-helix repeat-containing protein [Acidobacteriia bacterium]|nr:right-handed parallel beta-helix repeat-containing protein [Terriglobia bacterium]
MTVVKSCLSILVALGLIPGAVAQLTSFEAVDYPGSNNTVAFGINDAGDVVGYYKDAAQLAHGFLRRGSQFTTVDFPGARQTNIFSINARGDIGGVYYDNSAKQHGFVLSGSKFQTIDFPGAEQTMVYAMNGKGDLTGMYFAAGNPKHFGWALVGGTFSTIDHPLPNDMSCGSWISDGGEIAGHVQEKTGAYHGYFWRDGKFTSLIDFQGGKAWQFWDSIYGINDAGDMLGTYSDGRGKQRAFLRGKSGVTTFDVPGSQRTRATGMNRSGQIVGMFADGGGAQHGFLTKVAGTQQNRVLVVDDDGVDCPGGVRTIQEAVAAAPAGAVILVCPGIYQKTVSITGPDKNGLKLIATGAEGSVVLQGDYTERDGFHLENVSSVLVRGFTVRDFGTKPTTDTDWGAGNQIYLQDAHYNTIEQNTLINGDMMGIMLTDSGNNMLQRNVALVDNASLANCGIHMQGAKSANNVVRQNKIFGNKFAGIMIRGAGPGNLVADNTVVNNGRFGIDVEGTNEIWLEGNRVSYSQGFWGTATPGGKQPGLGINLVSVNKATVFDNRMRANSGTDLNWDGKGDNRIETNACDTAIPADGCKR